MSSNISRSSSIAAGDMFVTKDSQNNDYRLASQDVFLTWLKSAFARQDYTTTIYTPVNGFTISFDDDGLNRWMILRPAGALASGTIVLPSVTNAVDGQELLVTSTYPITTFTINANGASEVNGAPTVLASGDTFTLRFNKTTLSWYRVA